MTTNQEPNLNRIVFEVDEDYEFDYEIIVSNEGDDDVLITLPNTVEILLTSFHPSKSFKQEGSDADFTTVSVSYPLEELPQDYNVFPLTLADLLSHPNTLLHVVISSEKLTEVIRKDSMLWVGTNFSMRLPNDFAEKLQTFLITGEIIND